MPPIDDSDDSDDSDGMNEADEPADERRDGPPSEDRVRLELVLFADLIQRLEESGSLLKAVPFLLSRLGDIRRVLFDYEVRGTERLLPIEDPREREARRILREVEERKREMLEEWGDSWTPPPGEARDEDIGGDGQDRDERDDRESGAGE